MVLVLMLGEAWGPHGASVNPLVTGALALGQLSSHQHLGLGCRCFPGPAPQNKSVLCGGPHEGEGWTCRITAQSGREAGEREAETRRGAEVSIWQGPGRGASGLLLVRCVVGGTMFRIPVGRTGVFGDV